MSPDPAPLEAHIDLLQSFLADRDQIVEKIQGLLNAQGKPAHSLHDRPQLARQFEDLFFGMAVPADLIRLRGQLQQAHWASGFRPRVMPGIPNEMFDPADMITRAFGLWQHTRWPGRNGRIRYAHTLFNLYVIRCLALLTMRLWDVGADARGKLAQVQAVLDQLWKSSPADQPVLVRDVRWLVPVALSPTTDDLGPYFTVAQHIAESLQQDDRLEIHKATVVMAGGHLRSQLRHYNMQGTSLDDPCLILSTRGSNALDFAMTIQNLVPLLAAYEDACSGDDHHRRLELAGVICQGVSPDPELFVNRIDLLGPYSMIEHLFITEDKGRAIYTPIGMRHIRLWQEYATRIARVSKRLLADCPIFRPLPGSYSPYGVMFGFSSNLFEHMSMKTLQPDAETRFGIEDVFSDAQPDAARLAWVGSWRKLPHIRQEVLKLYDYPQQFAEAMYDRVERALRRSNDSSRTLPAGHMYIATKTAGTQELPVEFILSSDPQAVAAGRAKSCDEAQLLHDRLEGMYMVSYQTPHGWTAISKDVLTNLLGAGRDATICGLPDTAAEVLDLMCALRP